MHGIFVFATFLSISVFRACLYAVSVNAVASVDRVQVVNVREVNVFRVDLSTSPLARNAMTQQSDSRRLPRCRRWWRWWSAWCLDISATGDRTPYEQHGLFSLLNVSNRCPLEAQWRTYSHPLQTIQCREHVPGIQTHYLKYFSAQISGLFCNFLRFGKNSTYRGLPLPPPRISLSIKSDYSVRQMPGERGRAHMLF